MLGMNGKSSKGSKHQKSQEESEGAKRVEEFLDVLENDQKAMQKIIPMLPKKVFKQMTSDQFNQHAKTKFESLDQDQDQVLSRQELFPMIVELSQAPPQIVDLTHCERFIKIFDMRNAGTMELDEFLNFLRFMQISMYLASKDGKEDFPEGRKILADSKLIEDILKLLEQIPREDIDNLISHIPENLKAMLSGDNFTAECSAAYKKLDTQGKNAVPSQKLKQTVMSTTGASPHAVDTTQCKRFAAIFSKDESGNLKEDEFEQFKRALMLALYFQSPDGRKALGGVKKMDTQAAVTATAVLAAGKSSVKSVRSKTVRSLGGKHINAHDLMAAERIEDFLLLLEQDKHSVQKIVPLLPSHVFEHLTSDEFVEEAREQFVDHDDDEDEALSPQELFPLIVEMSEARAQDVDFKQCERFVGIFDMHQDAVLREDEFLNFKRFMFIITYLDSEQGRTEFPDGRKILDDSRKIEDLIACLEDEYPKDHKELFDSLPSQVREMIQGDEFAQYCKTEFAELDEQKGDENLSAHQLRPLILGNTDAHPNAVDKEQCERFAAIFVNKKTGLIDLDSYTGFKKFLVIFSQTEIGSKALGIKRLTRKSTKMTRTSSMIDELEASHSREMMDFLTVIEHDKRVVETIMSMLPAHVSDHLSSETFTIEARKKFDSLDSDKDGKLEPKEFWSAIVDFSHAPAQSIDLGCTKRFLKIFDSNKDGTIHTDEFVSFARFMDVSYYVHSEKGIEEFPEGLQIMLDAKRVEALVKMLEVAPPDIQDILPQIPEDMQTELMGETFASESAQTFKALEAEGTGQVPQEKLKSVLISTVDVSEHAVDLDQCIRLATTFGSSTMSDNPGVTEDEFLNMRRFLRVFNAIQREQEANEKSGRSSKISRSASKVKDENAEVSSSSDAAKANVYEFLAEVERQTKALEDVMLLLPAQATETMAGDAFTQAAKTKFETLDLDMDDMLSPQELCPLISDFSGIPAEAFDAKACERFLSLFVSEGRELMNLEDFTKFVCFSSVKMYLNSDAGKKEVPDGFESKPKPKENLAKTSEETSTKSLGEYLSMLEGAGVVDIDTALECITADDRRRLENVFGTGESNTSGAEEAKSDAKTAEEHLRECIGLLENANSLDVEAALNEIPSAGRKRLEELLIQSSA